MKKPYQNLTRKIQHIGSVTVMPGQVREIEEMHIQAHSGVTAKAKPEASPENPLTLFLSANVKTIKANLADLSEEELDSIETIEQADEKPRNGVLKAIAEERLNRAAAANASDVEKFIATLDGMSDEELTEMQALYTDEADSVAYLDVVNAEIEKRAAASANGND